MNGVVLVLSWSVRIDPVLQWNIWNLDIDAIETILKMNDARHRVFLYTYKRRWIFMWSPGESFLSTASIAFKLPCKLSSKRTAHLVGSISASLRASYTDLWSKPPEHSLITILNTNYILVYTKKCYDCTGQWLRFTLKLSLAMFYNHYMTHFMAKVFPLSTSWHCHLCLNKKIVFL